MAPLLVLALAGGAAVVAAAVAGSKPSSPVANTKDWSRIRRVTRVTYPPPPFYPPNILRVRYPLVWWSSPTGDTGPSPGNMAIDVTGTPWNAVRLVRGTTPMFGSVMDERAWEDPGGPGTFCYTYCGDSIANVDVFGKTPVKNLGGKPLWRPCAADAPENKDLDHLDTWTQVKWHDEDSFAEAFVDAATRYFVPILITMAGTAIGGVGGAITAFAVDAMFNVAMGAKITDALVNSYQAHLASTVEKSAYYETFKKVATTYKQTKADLDAIRQAALAAYGTLSSASGSAGTDTVINQAVTAGMAAARAKQVQDAAIVSINARLDDNERIWFAECLKRGVYLQDWVLAMFGDDGADLLRWTFARANAALDAGKDPNAAVKPAIPKALVDALGKIMATGTGATAEGPIGTVATAGAPRRIQLATTRRKVA